MPIGPPDFAIQIMLGEVAGVITAGQKVLPAKALALGYYFKFPDLAAALRDVYSPKPESRPSHKLVATAGRITESAARGPVAKRESFSEDLLLT